MSNNSSQIEADAEFARRLQEEELRNAHFLMGHHILPDRRPAPYFHRRESTTTNNNSSSTASSGSANSNTGSGVPDRSPAPYAYTPGRGAAGIPHPPPQPPQAESQTHQTTHHFRRSFRHHPGNAMDPNVMDAFDHLNMMFPGFPRMTPPIPSRRGNAGRPTHSSTPGIDPGPAEPMAEMARFMGEFPAFFGGGFAGGESFTQPQRMMGSGPMGGGGSFFTVGGDLPAFFRNFLDHQPTTYEEFLEMIERRGNVNRGATDDEVSGITREKFQPRPKAASSAAGAAAGTDDAEKCVICLAEFERDEEVKCLPCGHIFHGECVDRWLKVNRTCPSCKRSIRKSDEEQNQQ